MEVFGHFSKKIGWWLKFYDVKLDIITESF
jgi:hypothetical protein